MEKILTLKPNDKLLDFSNIIPILNYFNTNFHLSTDKFNILKERFEYEGINITDEKINDILKLLSSMKFNYIFDTQDETIIKLNEDRTLNLGYVYKLTIVIENYISNHKFQIYDNNHTFYGGLNKKGSFLVASKNDIVKLVNKRNDLILYHLNLILNKQQYDIIKSMNEVFIDVIYSMEHKEYSKLHLVEYSIDEITKL